MNTEQYTEQDTAALVARLSNHPAQQTALRQTNEYTHRFGLSLSDADIDLLLTRRAQSLAEQGRIEFGNGILEKLVFTFCDSEFIFQEDYAKTLAELQDIFYLYKNESLDELTDDELLQTMRDAFDGECQGSLDYLSETCLEQFARSIRARTHSFIGRYEENE